MHCKRHVMGRRIVFAFCDKDLIGKKLEEKGVVVDLEKYARFYVGEDLASFDGEFESINAVGKKSIEFLIKKGVARKEDVRYVQEVPIIQIYKIRE